MTPAQSAPRLRLATPSDAHAIRALLAASRLPTSDVREGGPQEFLVALDGRALVGCVGLERHGDAALLRSLAVDEEHRGRGLGLELYRSMVTHAARRGVKALYLLTTTAEAFFAKRGFVRVAREAVPGSIAATAEFRSLCPASAVCMTRALDRDPRHFRADLLQLGPDVPGASMWAVALDRTMLTYFVVEPHCRFERHAHESEQITLVLEGELCFELDGGERVAVKAGEVFAIPSNVPHAVSTHAGAARAVDAWSPVRPDYAR
jgi:N-acetylglutamate synthase-like GNAT family acetyltransferase